MTTSPLNKSIILFSKAKKGGNDEVLQSVRNYIRKQDPSFDEKYVVVSNAGPIPMDDFEFCYACTGRTPLGH